MSPTHTIEHPGEILANEFLAAHGVTQYRVAMDTGVPPRRINEIVLGKRGITADTALRLALYFDNDPLYWLQLQARWDLQRARERLGSRLEQEVRRPGRSGSAKPRPAKRSPAMRSRGKKKDAQPSPQNPAAEPKPMPKPKPEPKPEPKPKPMPKPKLADHLL